MSKKHRFTVPLNEQHGKRAQTLFKSERRHLYHIYWSQQTQLISKNSLLVIRRMLSVFYNTVTADDKYSLLNRDNLTQQIQIQLSGKQKSFSRFMS